MKKNLKKGYTKESLKWALIGQGYSKIEVEKALKLVDKQLANEVHPLKTRPEIKYEAVAPKQYYEEKKSLWRRFLLISRISIPKIFPSESRSILISSFSEIVFLTSPSEISLK